ncbi:DMT family transporter [Szabonella alba]|uniref:DMT family transporter n=1 Tax=Szabonella alba TaxID=2804194 RepID=A0A8K0VBH8_9RHOB|nr:DMT family transporter [Szabonella alba]MBL4917188.1 DMT family transporter [Szabonella alba]
MTQPYRPLAAGLWMIGSVISFSAVAVAGRAVSHVHDTFEIMTWRSLVSLVILLAMMAATGRFREIRKARLGRHVVRNITHFTGQNLWFLALTLIPLAQVFALEFTSPIWVVLMAPLFLGERLTAAKIAAAAIGFSGTLIVARPDFGTLDIGVLAAAGAAFCFAATNVMTKTLTRHESIYSILFWLTSMQLVLGLLSSGYDGAMTLPTAETALPLVVIGMLGLSAHFCLTMALSLAPASVAIPVDFIRLPLAALLGWLLYAETVGWNVWLGGAMIIGAVWISLRAGSRASAQQAAPQATVTPRY